MLPSEESEMQTTAKDSENPAWGFHTGWGRIYRMDNRNGVLMGNGEAALAPDAVINVSKGF